MRELPSFQTTLVPMGAYVAEVMGEVQEKISAFDSSRNYLQLPLILKSEGGECFPFTWCFTPKSPKFADFLLAIGGRRLSSGNVQPPRGPYIGLKVGVSIGQRVAKGSKDGRLVNEVLSVYRYDESMMEPHADDDSTLPF